MKSKSSKRWLSEHFSDPFVKKAKESGYRSRAIFKLSELQDKYQLFKSNMNVVDLGASPGGWSQFVATKVKPKGNVFAIDLLPMQALPGVDFIQGDFNDANVFETLMDKLAHSPVDWVISDMAPNLSGDANVDIPRALHLAELALAFAVDAVRVKQGLLIKCFQGTGFDLFLQEIRKHFANVIISKPKASRNRSREVYIIARSLKSSL